MLKRRFACLALMASTLLPFHDAIAARAADLDVLTRSLSFLIDPPAGIVDLAIVYDSTSANSTTDAAELVDLTRSKKGPGFTFMPRLIDEQALDSLEGADLVLLAADAKALYALAFARARVSQALVVSLQQDCIDLGLCVMWVKGTPDVRIVLNRAAAQSVNARFNTTFRMMVQER